MGRGRGRGRKLANGRTTHEDKGSSGEEVVVVAPARKRRGRPQKRVAERVKNPETDDGDEDYQVGGAGGDDAKLKASSRADNVSAGTGTNSKRNRVVPKDEEDSNLDMEENNSSSTRSSNDESTTRSNGFRQVGSRRKSTPRRAAEAGI